MEEEDEKKRSMMQRRETGHKKKGLASYSNKPRCEEPFSFWMTRIGPVVARWTT